MITVITSLYKSERHLPKFIRDARRVSAYLERHGISHEFLLLPNAPDPEERVLLAHAHIPYSRIIPRELESLFATWNEGIERATYENICFWNVDDLRFGAAIRSGLKDLELGNDIVYFPFIYFRYVLLAGLKLLVNIRIITPPEFVKERFSKEMHSGPFFMFTRKAFYDVGPFDESLKIAGDFDWCARAATLGMRFLKNDTLAGIFSNDGSTLSGARDSRHAVENERIYTRYCAPADSRVR